MTWKLDLRISRSGSKASGNPILWIFRSIPHNQEEREVNEKTQSFSATMTAHLKYDNVFCLSLALLRSLRVYNSQIDAALGHVRKWKLSEVIQSVRPFAVLLQTETPTRTYSRSGCVRKSFRIVV
jgi:hypothetical protein